MFRAWKVGRVAGIDVFLHPTLLLLLTLPQVSMGGAYGLALISAGFGCVLLHEFGHALMARRFGIETVDITLYPIGGVARLERMPKAPGAELLIALAGPAVNFAIVLGLMLVSPFVHGRFLNELMFFNLILGVFNLIPAFPMDGGRVLRALLSGVLGRLRATEVAAGIGKGLALLFGILSVCFLRWQPAVLSAFIFMAASAELARVREEERERRYDGDDGVWAAPPGYHWVERGRGTWQLAPIIVSPNEGTQPQWR